MTIQILWWHFPTLVTAWWVVIAIWGCLPCAARRIQFIQRCLNMAPDAIRTRCRTALAQAMALGLPEQEIRAMAKLPEWQVAELVAVPETTKPKRGR